MSLVPTVVREQHNLRQAAHLSILIGIRDAWKRCRQLGNKPQEPDFVASLVLESSPIIYDAFKAVFENYGIGFSLTSVYCHQTPKVRYPGAPKTSCELGDILFVHVHRERSGQTRRNALLYQAKVTSKQRHQVPSSERHQLTLYTDWPEFEYYHSPPLSGEKRLISPPSPHRGAQYLLLDSRGPENAESGLLGLRGTYPIGSCIADSILLHHNDLASELIDFLVYRTGRAFGDRPSNGSNFGWTQTVWDLLDVSLKKVVKRKNSGRSTEPRISGGPIQLADGLCFARRTSQRASHTLSEVLGPGDANRLFSSDDGPPKDYIGQEAAEEETGIPLILMETSEFEE